MKRRPLVLTGGPAVGKTSTGRALAESRGRAAFIDVDDIRQLVVAGAEAPWLPGEGHAQQVLGVLNACSLARRFAGASFEVVIADVLTPTSCEVYRQELPGCLIVHLVVSFEEALRRAATRRVWLTEAEFEQLHRDDASSPPPADRHVDAERLSLPEQVAEIEQIWACTP